MLLLEFLCCKFSSDLVNEPTEDTYLVGVLLNLETECVAYDLAARELWSRGFIVLRVRAVSHWRRKSHSSFKVLGELWDHAELTGISVLVAETSVRFGGSTIRRVANEAGKTWKEETTVTRGEKSVIGS